MDTDRFTTRVQQTKYLHHRQEQHHHYQHPEHPTGDSKSTQPDGNIRLTWGPDNRAILLRFGDLVFVEVLRGLFAPQTKKYKEDNPHKTVSFSCAGTQIEQVHNNRAKQRKESHFSHELNRHVAYLVIFALPKSINKKTLAFRLQEVTTLRIWVNASNFHVPSVLRLP